VAPIQRSAQRLVPRQGGSAAACQQPEAVVQPCRDLVQADGRGPCNGKFKRKRNAIEAAADCRNRRHVFCGCSEMRVKGLHLRNEELDRAVVQQLLRFLLMCRWHTKRRDPIDALTFYAQRFAACCQHRDIWAKTHQGLRHGGGRIDQVLAIVKNEPRFFISEGPCNGLRERLVPFPPQAEDARHGGGHQGRIRQRRQLDKQNPALKLCCLQPARGFDRQGCLANPACPCKR
jgi:hypothetical protein